MGAKAAHLVVGEKGEGVAEAFLTKNGWRIVEKNFRCKGGELDLVATREEVLAFVEVKTRTEVMEDGFQPDVAVGPQKIRRLVRAARTWLVTNEDAIEGLFPRFDVITVVGSDAGCAIEHLEDAFEAPGG